METSSIVFVEMSSSRSGYVYRKTVTTFETFSLQICNVPRQVLGYSVGRCVIPWESLGKKCVKHIFSCREMFSV